MGTAAQPLLDDKSRISRAATRFSAGHPIDAVEELFGKEPAAQDSDPNKDPSVIEAQSEALKSFQDAQAKRDAAAAIQQMHPQHVHTLVQNARAGKYGPDAQKTAQQAMQSPAAMQSRAGARIARKRSSGL